MIKIKFNESITVPANKSGYFDLKILNAPETIDLDEEPRAKLNYIWKLQSFTSKGIEIKLSFADPLLVSPGIEQDIVHVTLLKHLYSSELELPLNDKYWRMQGRIRP